MTVKLSSRVQLTKLSDEPQNDGYAFEAIILSGEPIDTCHHFVIDLSSVVPHKPRLPVDYNHDDTLIIGYGENFQVTPDGLKATGKLIPGTFADEIVKLAKEGVPFEASVVIDLDNAVETRVGADLSTVVNGRTFQGPISVYANVPLTGFAICPHGADKFTTFTLLKKEIDFTMTKTTPKKQTKLSDEKDTPTGESDTPKVKDPDLAELCDMFGKENGLELWQGGADIAEVRQWKALNEKYSKYLSDDDDDEPKDDPPADDPKEDDEEDKTVTELKAAVTALKAEVTKLSAAIPRGETEPVKHNYETETKTEPQKELSPKEQYLQGVTARLKK